MSEILSIQELTYKIKHAVETLLPYIWVKGEVINYCCSNSGHVYFSLKDQEAYLHCVWFTSMQRETETFDPHTGEVFQDGPCLCLAKTISNGQQIICAGTLSVYPPRGGYQLLVDIAQPEGIGEWYRDLEKRKNALQQQGYFDLHKKQVIPQNPKKIAVITSPSGAAIHDFLCIAKERGTKKYIHIYPVSVQGEEAIPKIVQAIHTENDSNWAEVIVLIRGGGASQNLMIFNEQQLVEAIYTSKIPILAGIGHESDISFAELTADLRAATPSHAAQLLWPQQTQLKQQVDTTEIELFRTACSQLQKKQTTLCRLTTVLQWFSPIKKLERNELQLNSSYEKMCSIFNYKIKLKELQFIQHAKLSSYSIVKKISYYREQLYFLQKKSFSYIHSVLSFKKQQNVDNEHLLVYNFFEQYQKRLQQYERLHINLKMLNPHLLLKQGYALIYLQNGQILHSIKEAPEHTVLTIKISDGLLPVKVIKTSC